jgi:hypothetical protein
VKVEVEVEVELVEVVLALLALLAWPVEQPFHDFAQSFLGGAR